MKDKVSKSISSSLNFLENPTIRWTLIVLLVIYSVGIVPNLTESVSQLFDNMLVRLLFIVLIIYVSFKDKTLALVLLFAYIMSLRTFNASQNSFSNTISGLFGNRSSESFNQPQNEPIYEQSQDQQVDSQQILPRNEIAQTRMGDSRGGLSQVVDRVWEGASQRIDGVINSTAGTIFGGESRGGPLGYNEYVDCAADARNAQNSSDLNSPCTGVATWTNEMNPQGLNKPLGYGCNMQGSPVNA